MTNNSELPNSYRANQNPVKIKIEFSDDTGTKYSFNIEGNSKDNISKLIDFAQAVSSSDGNHESPEPIDTNIAKIYDLIRTNFKFGSFTSGDIKDAYEHDFQIPIGLSVVSTYLSRLAHRRFLLRSRNGSGWIYKLPRTQQNNDNQDSNILATGQITP